MRKFVNFSQYKICYLSISLMCILSISGQSHAQMGLEITPFYGYQFGGYLPTYQGEIDVSNNDNVGIILDIETSSLQRGTHVELSYTTQSAQLTYKEGYPKETKVKFDMTVEYYQIGGLYEQDLNARTLKGFGLFSLGATRFAPKPSEYKEEWVFSATLGLGLKAYLSPRFGLRFQGRMLIPMRWSGGGMWCSTGGCNIGVGTGSVILQADVSAGIIIRL